MNQTPSLVARGAIAFRVIMGQLALATFVMAPLSAFAQYQTYDAPFRFYAPGVEDPPYRETPIDACEDHEGSAALDKVLGFVYSWATSDTIVTEFVLEDAVSTLVLCYGTINSRPAIAYTAAFEFYCPYGGELNNAVYPPFCELADKPSSCPAGIDAETGLCIQAKTCPVGANPIDPATGAKLHDQVDIVHSSAAHPLNLQRIYNSQSPYWGSELSRGWSHNWQRHLILTARQRASPTVAVLHEDGSHSRFNRPLGSTKWVSVDQSKDTFDELRDIDGVLTGYTVKRFESDALETYSADGLLLSVRERNGWTAALRYSDETTAASIAPQPGLLIEVRNHFGRKLQFRYDAQARLVRSLDFAGKAVRYRYDDAGRLDRVTWQDNKFRSYHYEDPGFPNALTGVTDEAGVRYATYAYDDQGRAKSTELAGGKDRVEVQYSTDGTSTVTDYSGSGSTSRTYTFETAGGNIRPTAVSGPCVLCGSTQQSSSYDRVTGSLTKSIAHDGTVTFYQYDDAKARETERATFPKSFNDATTRPPLSNATKVVSTRWHAKWNLPLTVAEPNKITDYGYDGNGNQSSQSWSATKDDTGAKAFDAAKTGSLFKEIYEHNTNNLLKTKKSLVDGVVVAHMSYELDNTKGVAIRATNVLTGVASRDPIYDDYGRLTQETDPYGTLKRKFTLRGLMREESDDQATTLVKHNVIGLVETVDTGTGLLYEWKYAPGHQVKSVTLTGQPTLLGLDANQATGLRPSAAQPEQASTLPLPGGTGIRGSGWIGIGVLMWEIGKRIADSGASDETASEEKDCDPCKDPSKTPEWIPRDYKHLAKKGMSWKEIRDGTLGVRKAAKYHPAVVPNAVAQQAFEIDVWQRGKVIKNTNSEVYKVVKFGFVIGAYNGKDTSCAVVKCSAGEIHGHPTEDSECNKSGVPYP
jgi:YD repeat-containing protein